MNITRRLLTAVLLTLTACGQAPIPGDATSPNLAPLTFGSPGFDNAHSLSKHSSGVYVAGYTEGNLHGTAQGEADVFIRKYDTNGAVLWGKQFGTPSMDIAFGVASDSNNNAYVVGLTTGSLAGSRGNSDAFLRKYTSSGSVAWTRQFGTSGADSGFGVATYGTNVIYVVGGTDGNIAGSGSSGSTEAFIRKYNANGSVVWTRQFGNSQGDNALDVAVDSSGNAYVVGDTGRSLGGVAGADSDIFIRRYNASGTVTWTKQLHYSSLDIPRAVAISGNSIYLVASFFSDAVNSTNNDVRVVKYNTSGSLQWDKGLGGFGVDHVSDVSADSSGVVFAGGTDSSFGGTNRGPVGTFDGYLYKLSPSGSYVWSKHQGTYEYDYTNAVLVRTNGEVYAAGQTHGVLVSSNSGSADGFLRRLNGTTGATVWTDQ